MHQERENLDIIFRKRKPEDVLEKIRNGCDWRKDTRKPYELQSFEEFDYFGKGNLTGYSLDEVRLRYDQMREQTEMTSGSVFGLLHEYGEKVLVCHNQEPQCRIERVLGWNSISSRLGQDLIVTAWLAEEDRKAARAMDYSRHFDWPYCLRSDDLRLNRLLERGVAENHFHLGGSTQSFALSWAALMNHPKLIYKTVREGGRFRHNLVDNHTEFSEKNEMCWVKRLRYAAFIRALLFRRCIDAIEKDCLEEQFEQYDRTEQNELLLNEVESVRALYGAKSSRVKGGRCIDYTMSTALYALDPDGYNRLLTGERALLYHCLCRIYTREFSDYEVSLFYLYLLIKHNFRGELIQINRRKGFYNFSLYQDRKKQFYPLPEYEVEAVRLSICTSIRENNIVFLEARCMPETTAAKLAAKIYDTDRLIQGVASEDCAKVFYVLHFAKETFMQEEVERLQCIPLRPRNWKVRKRSYLQAMAIYAFRSRYYGVHRKLVGDLQSRVRGIDACSKEIGCRPETFATEFRFLRNEKVDRTRKPYIWEIPPVRDLGITYHVGEDFLDVCDGLRAVDEAVEFLELRNGDRIGHGLVLGVDVQRYYADRQNKVYLTRQDYLDNCVWLLFRALEWQIPMTTSGREYLKKEAYDQAFSIYGEINQGQCMDILEALYRSWHLRGDHPELYITGEFQEGRNYSVNPYDRYRVGKKEYQTYRNDRSVAELCYRYHFDKEVKQKGLQVVAVKIEPWYIELLEGFQLYMRQNIVAKNGIALECNPTSNRLIGFFNSYDQHPIQKFSDHILHDNSREWQIISSVNTDDLGVFDTSLNYEYALLLCALGRKRHLEGDQNDEKLYAYLEHLRQNGLKIVFR